MEQQNQQPMQEKPNVNRDFQPLKKSPFADKRLLYIVAAAITGFLIPVGIFFVDFYISHWHSKSSIPAVMPQRVIQNETPRQPQSQDLQNWQTYRNEEFGFEVKYPEGWYAIWRGVLDITNEQMSAVGTVSENGVNLQLSISKHSALANLFETLKYMKVGDTHNENLVLYTKLADLDIGGIPAVRYRADRSSVPYIGLPIAEEVMFKQGDYLVEAIFIGFTDSALNQHKQLMDQILSTFRFVE